MVLSETFQKRLMVLSGIILEGKKENDKPKEIVPKDFVHLPDLTMSKKVLIKYLDEVYGIKLKGQE